MSASPSPRQRAAQDRAAKAGAQSKAPTGIPSTLDARLAEMFDDDSDRMVGMALMGCRIGTDDVILDRIIAEHKRCPRGYCEHLQARDRYAEEIGWDD